MARKFGLQDGTSYLSRYNWGIGMNDDVAYNDRSGYTTSVEMLTGGVEMPWDAFGGLEVVGQYELDPSAEERTMTTFSEDEMGPQALGHIGMLTTEGAGMQPTETTVGGKKVDLSSPQNYSSGTSMKKG